MQEVNHVLKNISLKQLVKESTQMQNILYRIINSDSEIISLISNPIIPFLAYICDGILAIFPTEIDVPQNDMELDSKEFKRMISKIRVGHKLLSDKRYLQANKLITEKQRESIELLISDYTIVQKIALLFIGQEDYGVFKYQEVDFFNNIQLYIYFDYLFKDYKNIQYINLEKFIGPKVRQLSSSLASLLTTVVAVFEKEWGLILDKDAKIEISGKEFTRTDYFLINSARKNIFDNNLPYELQVWLHSNLCQLNFVSIIIPKVLKNHNDLYIRFMFIAFLECAKVLKKLMNQKGVLNDKQVNQVNSILNNSVYVILSKGSVRSNIAHYQLENYDVKVFSGDNTLIDIIEYETEKNFYQFWKKFNEQFTNLKLVLEELLY